MKNIRSTTIWILLSLLVTLPAFAQEGSDETASFGEILDVRVINLEVVVTEGRNRIGGLSPDDFQLLVDGQEIPIEYFTEVDGGRALSSETLTEESTVPALQPGEAVGTRYLVFIDEVFAIKPYRNHVLRGLAEQLSLLGPADRMAVVAFNGRKIDMLSSWSSSIPHLERVLQEAEARPSQGMQRRMDRRLDYDLRRASYGRSNDRRAYKGAGWGSRTHSLVEEVVSAVTSTLRGFAKPTGRKVMVLLSGGWPGPNEDNFSSSIRYGSQASDRSLFKPITDTANRLGFTLYPVDVQGLESHFGGAEFGTSQAAERARRTSADREWVEEGVLVDMARETGGKALLDGARGSALEKIVDDTRSYYWLGFTPSWNEDDTRHKVKVEVRRRGLKVRSRQTFSDLSRATEVTMMVESAQLFNLPLPAQAELDVTFGAPGSGKRKVVVPLHVEFPLDQITLLPDAKGYVAQLELRIAVTDDRGRRADIPVVPVKFHSAEAPEAGSMGSYDMSFRIRKRPHQVLVSLYDKSSGTMLAKEVDLSF